MMEKKSCKCDNCGKQINEMGDFFRISVVRKKGKSVSEKNFCSLDCANRWNLVHKEEMPLKETLEQEVKEAIEEEKEHIKGAKKQIVESAEEIRLSDPGQSAKETPYGEKPLPEEYIENQEFYIKKDEDFDKIKETIHEIKSQDSGMASVDDDEVYEIEPETRKLKLRKMPRTILDRLKEKKVILDYYKQL